MIGQIVLQHIPPASGDTSQATYAGQTTIVLDDSHVQEIRDQLSKGRTMQQIVNDAFDKLKSP